MGKPTPELLGGAGAAPETSKGANFGSQRGISVGFTESSPEPQPTSDPDTFPGRCPLARCPRPGSPEESPAGAAAGGLQSSPGRPWEVQEPPSHLTPRRRPPARPGAPRPRHRPAANSPGGAPSPTSGRRPRRRPPRGPRSPR